MIAASLVLLAFLIGGPAWAFPPEVERVLGEVAAAGIPTAPLEDKAREGLAKGVQAERTAAALRDQLARLVHAREVLGQPTSGPALVAAAAALRAGGSPPVLRRLARLPEPARALEGLTDLLGLGISEPDAVALIEEMVADPSVRVEVLVGAVGSLMAGGMSDAAALAAVRTAAGGIGASSRAGNEGAPYGPGGRAGHDNGGNGGNGGNGSDNGNRGDNGSNGNRR